MQAAILAAVKVISRFQEKGEFIQAWGEMGDKDSYRLIIDCLLNLPLLYWASEVTGDPKFADIAHRHIRTAMKCVVREDYSTIHTYFFDPETGLPLKGVTHQGNRDNSAWARGQAWGVYGTILSYQYTQDPEYLELFRHISDYYLRHLPEDLIPFWDFDFTDGSSEPRFFGSHCDLRLLGSGQGTGAGRSAILYKAGPSDDEIADRQLRGQGLEFIQRHSASQHVQPAYADQHLPQ